MEEQTQERLLARINELEAQVRSLSNSIIDRKDEYGLRWIDVPEAFETESENKIPILEEVKELAIKNDDGKPTHILIEGDNYHALQCLNYTHKGKIDVIYIDPPYNTGKEFVYKDKRVLDKFPNGQTIDSNHPLRHSAWLSFMSKRIELAKNLLSERGVIFISIDDNEQANLKLLCDKVFGSQNFVGTLIHQRAKGGGQAKHIVKGHDYIHIYSKDISDVKLARQKIVQQKTISINGELYIKNDDIIRKTFGKYDKTLGDRRCFYEELEKYRGIEKKKEIDNKINEGELFLEENKDGFHVICKYEKIDDATSKLYSIIKVLSEEGKKELETLEIPFSYPKPTEIIRQLIEAATTDNSIVLDFFAGSGTTMHSTLIENQKQNNLQCILIQAPEPTWEYDKNNKMVPKKDYKDAYEQGYRNISQLTYSRCERVINGYKEKISPLGNSLKYYKTAFVGTNTAASATDEDKVALAHKAGNLIAIAENTLEEIETTDSYQIFQNGNQYTAIYFTGNLEHFAEYVQKIEELRNSSRLVKVSAYIYCIGNVDVFESEFNKLTRINLHAIPQPIIEIYKQLNA